MVTSRLFGTAKDGRTVRSYTIENKALSATLLDYGVTVQSLVFGGTDVACGYDAIDGYEQNDGYVGATVGRFANRVADGRFTLDGVTYDIGRNDTAHGCHLHGGTIGFDKQVWDATVVDEYTVRFTHTFADGEEGFPGNLTVAVTVEVTADNALSLCYHAETDKATVLNLTNHCYFNLNGWDDGDILNHELTVCADHITPVSAQLIPMGELLAVAGTPFDFNTAKPIGQDIEDPHPQMKNGGGYDHNFVLRSRNADEAAVILHSPKTNITLTCLTDQPGVQIYTANFLEAQDGKGGINLYKHQGVCVETQHFPDSPNQPSFPSVVLRAGEAFDSTTVYRFS